MHGKRRYNCSQCKNKQEIYSQLEILPLPSLNATPTVIESDLDPNQQQQLIQVMNDYKELFDTTQPGRTNILQHEIYLEEERPITLRPYHRKSPMENAFLKKEIQKMLDNRIISPSDSP